MMKSSTLFECGPLPPTSILGTRLLTHYREESISPKPFLPHSTHTASDQASVCRNVRVNDSTTTTPQQRNTSLKVPLDLSAPAAPAPQTHLPRLPIIPTARPVIPAPRLRHSREGGNLASRIRHAPIATPSQTAPPSPHPSTSFPHPSASFPHPVYVIPAPRLRHSREGGNLPLRPGRNRLDVPLGNESNETPPNSRLHKRNERAMLVGPRPPEERTQGGSLYISSTEDSK